MNRQFPLVIGESRPRKDPLVRCAGQMAIERGDDGVLSGLRELGPCYDARAGSPTATVAAETLLRFPLLPLLRNPPMSIWRVWVRWTLRKRRREVSLILLFTMIALIKFCLKLHGTCGMSITTTFMRRSNCKTNRRYQCNT